MLMARSTSFALKKSCRDPRPGNTIHGYKLQTERQPQLDALVLPFLLVVDIIDAAQANGITSVNPKVTDVDLHATQHTEVAAFKSLLPVLQQRIALVGEYSELRAHLEGQRLGWLDI